MSKTNKEHDCCCCCLILTKKQRLEILFRGGELNLSFKQYTHRTHEHFDPGTLGAHRTLSIRVVYSQILT